MLWGHLKAAVDFLVQILYFLILEFAFGSFIVSVSLWRFSICSFILFFKALNMFATMAGLLQFWTWLSTPQHTPYSEVWPFQGFKRWSVVLTEISLQSGLIPAPPISRITHLPCSYRWSLLSPEEFCLPLAGWISTWTSRAPSHTPLFQDPVLQTPAASAPQNCDLLPISMWPHSAWRSPPCTLQPRKMLQAESGQSVVGLTLFPLSSNDKSEFQMWASTAISVDNSVHHYNSTSPEFSGVWSLVWIGRRYNRSSVVSDYHWAYESHTQLCCLVLLARTTRASQAPPQTAHLLVPKLVAKHPRTLVLGASCIPVTFCSATWCACGEWPVSR